MILELFAASVLPPWLALPPWLELPSLAQSVFAAVLVFFIYRAVRTGVREGFQKALGRVVDRRKLNAALDLLLMKMGTAETHTPRGQIAPPQPTTDGGAIGRVREAMSLAAEGNLKDAQKRLEELRKQHPNDAHVLWAVADVYIREEQYGAATAVLEEAVKITSDDAALWHNLGVARFRAEKYGEALQAFRKSMEHSSSNPGTYLFAGFALWQLKQIREAIEVSRNGLRLAEVNGDASAQARAMNNLAYYLFDVADQKAREAGLETPVPDESQEEAERLHQGAVKRRGLTAADLDTLACLCLWRGDPEGALRNAEASIKQGGPNATRVEHYLRFLKLRNKGRR